MMTAARGWPAADPLVDHVDGAARSELAVHQLVVAVRIGQRRAIDLRRKRPETVLVLACSLAVSAMAEVRSAVDRRDQTATTACFLSVSARAILTGVLPPPLRPELNKRAALLVVARGQAGWRLLRRPRRSPRTA